jgi:glucokinase
VTIAFASVAIGGTKCSVALAVEGTTGFEWLARRRFATMDSPANVISLLIEQLDEMRLGTGAELMAIGLVCGGPLDEEAGLVLSPPNLPRWHRIDVMTPFREHFEVPVRLLNDANAGVLAEWIWGAARGASDAVFITMGTGLGAGMLLNGRLHRGASGLAGEIGHWRLADSGPNGYGKDGSFEGFCSGSGIAKWAQLVALQRLQEGSPSAMASEWYDVADISAEQLAKAADDGDEMAIQLWSNVGRRLGAGLSLLVDILNPDVIVIGGIFNHQRDRLEDSMMEMLDREALTLSLSACRIVPSGLGEQIGDYSGLVTALIGSESTSEGILVTSAMRVPSHIAQDHSRGVDVDPVHWPTADQIDSSSLIENSKRNATTNE